MLRFWSTEPQPKLIRIKEAGTLLHWYKFPKIRKENKLSIFFSKKGEVNKRLGVSFKRGGVGCFSLFFCKMSGRGSYYSKFSVRENLQR